jgi:hypothetical protein
MQVTTAEIIYPSSDGQPMAESTIQYELIVKIKEGCESLFKHDPNVFVAADLLWYSSRQGALSIVPARGAVP